MRLFTVNSVIYYTFLYYKLVKKVKMIFGLSSTMFIKIEMAFACLKACRCSGPISLKHTHTHTYMFLSDTGGPILLNLFSFVLRLVGGCHFHYSSNSNLHFTP